MTAVRAARTAAVSEPVRIETRARAVGGGGRLPGEEREAGGRGVREVQPQPVASPARGESFSDLTAALERVKEARRRHQAKAEEAARKQEARRRRELARRTAAVRATSTGGQRLDEARRARSEAASRALTLDEEWSVLEPVERQLDEDLDRSGGVDRGGSRRGSAAPRGGAPARRPAGQSGGTRGDAGRRRAAAASGGRGRSAAAGDGAGPGAAGLPRAGRARRGVGFGGHRGGRPVRRGHRFPAACAVCAARATGRRCGRLRCGGARGVGAASFRERAGERSPVVCAEDPGAGPDGVRQGPGRPRRLREARAGVA